MLVRSAAKYGLLAAARIALCMANPVGSRFPVGAAALSNYGRVIIGANKETHSGDSIHAEEALVAQLWKGEQLVRMAIVNREGNLLAPCGGCRDFLADYTIPQAKVLMTLKKSASQEWFPIAGLLPNIYTDKAVVSAEDTGSTEYLLFQAALETLRSATYAPYTGKTHGAALLTASNLILSAARREDASWHHDGAVENLLGMLAQLPGETIETVLYLDAETENTPLFPCGRELQKLFEEAQKGGEYFNVIAASKEGLLWYRRIDQLLPFAFGPNDLGITKS